MKAGHFLHCCDCETLFRPSRYDRAPEYRMTPDGVTETMRDDCMAFLTQHARHRLETLRLTSEQTFHTGALWDATSPSTFRMMTASEKSSYDWGVIDVVSVAFFSLMTAGILPAIFFSLAAARRRLMKTFIRNGLPETAEVLRIENENTAFGEKLARVNYQFWVQGTVHRDSDLVLPALAHRWQAGDRVPILYTPGDYDSVIVAVE